MLANRAVWVLVAAGSTLLTASASRACQVVAGGLVLIASALFITSLACSDERTPFERIVVLLCILLRMDSRPYIGLPKMPERHSSPLASKEHRASENRKRLDRGGRKPREKPR